MCVCVRCTKWIFVRQRRRRRRRIYTVFFLFAFASSCWVCCVNGIRALSVLSWSFSLSLDFVCAVDTYTFMCICIYIVRERVCSTKKKRKKKKSIIRRRTKYSTFKTQKKEIEFLIVFLKKKKKNLRKRNRIKTYVVNEIWIQKKVEKK